MEKALLKSTDCVWQSRVQLKNVDIIDLVLLTLQRGVTGTARMLHALTHSSVSRQVREQM